MRIFLRPPHVVISFIRFCARAISAAGVFRVFLMKPCTTPIWPSVTKNTNRAILLLDRLLRTSHSPAPSERHNGMPIGHRTLDGREIGADCPAILGRQASQPNLLPVRNLGRYGRRQS